MNNINFTRKNVIRGVSWLGLLVCVVWLIGQQIGQQQEARSVSGEIFYISHDFYTAQQKESVTERHLFGESHAVESDDATLFRVYDHPLSEYIIQNAPESDSPLKLTGIIYSLDANAAMITVESDNMQQDYRTGESISPGNEKILLVLPDKVIVDSNGYYRSLHFKSG
ncbi:hypothetical protein Dpoa2040_001361 [Dickeya sp. CFBP 2040]|nr:hypothetical protein [Dickeya sp. CFBP 2040]